MSDALFARETVICVRERKRERENTIRLEGVIVGQKGSRALQEKGPRAKGYIFLLQMRTRTWAATAEMLYKNKINPFLDCGIFPHTDKI